MTIAFIQVPTCLSLEKVVQREKWSRSTVLLGTISAQCTRAHPGKLLTQSIPWHCEGQPLPPYQPFWRAGVWCEFIRLCALNEKKLMPNFNRKTHLICIPACSCNELY